MYKLGEYVGYASEQEPQNEILYRVIGKSGNDFLIYDERSVVSQVWIDRSKLIPISSKQKVRIIIHRLFKRSK